MRLTFITTSIVAFVAIQALAFFFLYSRQNVAIYPSNEQDSKVHILILSSWRSGSSFVGQVFSQHPDVFYLMEPAWHVWVQMNRNSAKVLKMAVRDLVRSTFLCDMSAFDAYMSEDRLVSHLFQWEVSRALCSPPMCNHYARTDLSNDLMCKKHCNMTKFFKMEEACKTYSHVVIKEVRFFELKSLFPLFTDPLLNLKIIHLVRDPRAVLKSREKSLYALVRDNGIVLGTEGKQLEKEKAEASNYEVMKEICKSHILIHELANEEAPNLLKQRYMMVRYEDVVRDPLKEISAMYKFAGLNLTPKLESWVYNITHGEGTGSAFKITSRNARSISEAWRTEMPYEKISKIQKICGKAMDMLGYEQVQSEYEQKLLSRDLLLPQRKYKFSWLSSDEDAT
ncbi:carbohydrate sulfotransferase 6 [Pristis pectinata]|uniref:carbohydrate sulfotransferase 6 n=1 Tax=Pristis pectinata TaxID=685728 RepID=UPI00223DB1EE|nr:carbohydrate sulfotransferase 6 [Pristis pectinata]XP_051884470.1 carbohydrate sulfotransferase 6 [Pristis pectinata]XP_051884471.1 carbohydrate sulfotransferase 6 [Pristis pectinata]